MKTHLQCAEQQLSRSNLTKYCACHAERLAYLVLITYETSFTMRGATDLPVQLHQILRLSRRKTRILSLHHIWNLIYNARSNRPSRPTSPNTAPVTQNDTAKLQRKCPKTGETSFPMRGRSENDPTMIREWSDHENANRNPPRKWGYFSSSPGAFSIVKYNVSSPILHSKIHQVLRLPQKVTLDLHRILPLPRKVTLELHQILPLPRKVTLELHQILHLPRKVTRITHPRDIWNLIYNARSNQCLPPNSPNTAPATQNDHLTCGRNLRKTGETSFPMRGRSENDPSMIRPWKRKPQPASQVRLLFELPRSIFYCKIQRFEPNLTFKPSPSTFTKYCTCHEKWHLNFIYSTTLDSSPLDTTLLDTTLLDSSPIPTRLDSTLLDTTLLDTILLDSTLLDLLYLTLLYLTLLYLTLLYLTLVHLTLLYLILLYLTLLYLTLLYLTLFYLTLLYLTYSTWHYSTWPTLLDPTLLDTTLLDTILLDSTLLDSTLLESTLLDTTLLDSPLLDTTLLDPTLLDSTLLDSTLLDTTLLDTTLLDSTLLYLTLLGCRSYIGSFSSKLPLTRTRNSNSNSNSTSNSRTSSSSSSRNSKDLEIMTMTRTKQTPPPPPPPTTTTTTTTTTNNNHHNNPNKQTKLLDQQYPTTSMSWRIGACMAGAPVINGADSGCTLENQPKCHRRCDERSLSGWIKIPIFTELDVSMQKTWDV